MPETVSRQISNTEFVFAVRSILTGARCRSAWLGYGEMLYVGFELPGGSRDNSPRRPSRLRELSTFWADWVVSDADQKEFRRDDSREALIGPVDCLIGRSVESLNIDPDSWTIELRLSGHISLSVIPDLLEQDADEPEDSDTWVVQEGEFYYSVSRRRVLTVDTYIYNPGDATTP